MSRMQNKSTNEYITLGYAHLKIKAVASNGTAAVMAVEIEGSIFPYTEFPARIRRWENRAEYRALFIRAAFKLGWVFDKSKGWIKPVKLTGK